MNVPQMKNYLLKWNPHWNKLTINKWGDNQTIAVYNKEKIKNTPVKLNHKQLSFF